MALDNGATIIPGRGTVFVDMTGTAASFDYKTVNPRDPSTFPGWDCLGHTSRENTVALAKDGGDAEQKGSWWDAALRSVSEASAWSWTVNSLQVDRLTMGLAFPGGVIRDGAFWVPGAESEVDIRAFILCVDSTARLGIELPNTSMKIGDAPEISTEDFFEIQLLGQILSDPTTGDRIGFHHPSFDTPPEGGA